MIDLGPNSLLMIEPTRPAEKPIDDALTARARELWNQAVRGVAWRGVHVCRCGLASDNCSWRVRGLSTNSLMVHYIREHRSEVPRAEIEKLLALKP